MTKLESIIRDLAAIDGKGELEMNSEEAKKLRPGDYVRIAVNPGTVRCYYAFNGAPKPGQRYKVLRIGEKRIIFNLEDENTGKVIDGDYGISWIAAGSGSRKK